MDQPSIFISDAILMGVDAICRSSTILRAMKTGFVKLLALILGINLPGRNIVSTIRSISSFNDQANAIQIPSVGLVLLFF
jgi:hypothetical protein